jgi:hypothetical protein
MNSTVVAYHEASPKVEHARLLRLCPCPENNGAYGKQSLDDPDIRSLIDSIRKNGLREPIHIDPDNVIISGHRRRFCALEAGLSTVPVIRLLQKGPPGVPAAAARVQRAAEEDWRDAASRSSHEDRP